MPGVSKRTEGLIAAIQQSEEYISYNELRSFITRESGIADRVNGYRRQLFYLQNRAVQDDDQAAIEQLQKDYQDILELPKVMDYLAAEQALVEMMRKVYDRIGSAVTLDLSFLEE